MENNVTKGNYKIVFNSYGTGPLGPPNWKGNSFQNKREGGDGTRLMQGKGSGFVAKAEYVENSRIFWEEKRLGQDKNKMV